MAENVTSGSTAVQEATGFNKKSGIAVVSQFFGFFLDAYDLTLILSIAPVLAGIFFPASINPLLGTFEILLVYALTIIFRPLGSAIFGNLGDKLGRKNVLIVTILGLAGSSGLTAALPDYATAGIMSFTLFAMLRVLVGTFAGGEYAAGHPFAMEWTPVKWRGTISGVIQGGFPFGAAAAASVEGVFLGVFGISGLESYAWRYLFLTTIIPAMIALILRIKASDTPVFNSLKSSKNIRKHPFLDLFREPGMRRNFMVAMVWMTGLFLTGYGFLAYVTVVLEHAPSVWAGSNIRTAVTIYTISSFFAFAGIVAFGTLTQKFGRRKTSLYWTIFGVTLPIPLFYGLMSSAAAGNFTMALIMAILIGFTIMMPTGITLAFLSESFPTSSRSSGVGFGFSSGVFFGAWFGIYAEFLHNHFFASIDKATNIWFSAAVVIIIGSALVGVAMYFAHETAGKDLSKI